MAQTLHIKICMEEIHGLEIFLLRITAGTTLRSRAAGTRRTRLLLHHTRKRHNRKIRSHLSALARLASQTTTGERLNLHHHYAIRGPEADARFDDTMYVLSTNYV